ncbi:phosphonoacetaldehyde hydrolase [uncultured Albimonas sp.]|uniref:phosphonoacetaldehyde hydrolase n=1 Tax=uncultured Albimonas sp. TaxID=1331701 RepID=UPI0030EB353A
MKFDAVIFDWAGTMIDFGSFAPMGVFVEAFARFGVTATIEEARGPMGAPKRAHIQAMLAMPSIRAQWQAEHGRAPTEEDVDAVYAIFVPMNEAVAPKYATLVPGAKSTLDALAARGIRVGSTTGYVRSIMKGVIPVAAAQGFSPECIVCADDVEGGRPGAEQMFLAFEQMSLNRGAKVLKVDDTEPGIAEGVAVGAVTVGVALSGNIAGLTVEDLMALPDDERAALLAKASGILRAAGADHVIETVADLPDLIEALEAKG